MLPVTRPAGPIRNVSSPLPPTRCWTSAKPTNPTGTPSARRVSVPPSSAVTDHSLSVSDATSALTPPPPRRFTRTAPSCSSGVARSIAKTSAPLPPCSTSMPVNSATPVATRVPSASWMSQSSAPRPSAIIQSASASGPTSVSIPPPPSTAALPAHVAPMANVLSPAPPVSSAKKTLMRWMSCAPTRSVAGLSSANPSAGSPKAADVNAGAPRVMSASRSTTIVFSPPPPSM